MRSRVARRRAARPASQASSRSHLPTSAATSRFVVRVRMQHGEVEQVGRDARCGAPGTPRAPARGRGKRIGAPDFHSRGITSRRRARHSASALHDPLRALGQRRLDLGERHPARRAHGEPVQVDLHADRAPARADQPVVDGFAGQHDARAGPSRAPRARSRRPTSSRRNRARVACGLRVTTARPGARLRPRSTPRLPA